VVPLAPTNGTLVCRGWEPLAYRAVLPNLLGTTALERKKHFSIKERALE